MHPLRQSTVLLIGAFRSHQALEGRKDPICEADREAECSPDVGPLGGSKQFSPQIVCMQFPATVYGRIYSDPVDIASVLGKVGLLNT